MRNLANKKLNMSDVEPKGATYSRNRSEEGYGYERPSDLPARIYSNARVLPISCESLCERHERS